jgi:serine protein kinase
VADNIQSIKDAVKTRFEDSKRVLTFEDFFKICAGNPYRAVRNAPSYILDAIDHFGVQEIPVRKTKKKRYRIFDHASVETPTPLVGHEEVQEKLVKILTGFARAGKADKLILLHGPNGSAKSSLVRVLFDGIEEYSRQEAGMAFSFSWVFPHDSFDRKTLGIGQNGPKRIEADVDSYAKLEHDQIGAIVRSELHENPLFLIPRAERAKIFAEWLNTEHDPARRTRMEASKEAFLRAELSHKNALIFDALLDNYGGDFTKVLRHVRVERHYLSPRLRKGLVTIEPQLAVDAGMRQVTLDRSLANLPPALQSLNLFQLEGHLVDGNRGMVEYNDLLKRPLEHFKYLLSTCETGSLSLGGILVYLDSIFIGSTNDRQLEAFREHPEYNSFKARMELIKVPYLLRVSEEEKIYETPARRAAGTKELVPHTKRILALWAVGTRLKKPILKSKNALLTRVLENLSPLQKAKLYDVGDLPDDLNDEQRRELKGHLEDLVAEHQQLPYYEGLLGASARELKAILQIAAQNDQFPTLGPNAVFHELRQLVRRPMDFEYLRQEAVGGYHDFAGLIEKVRTEWMDWVEGEMRSSLDLEQEPQLLEFLTKYVYQATRFVRGEKVKNRITGQNEDADESLMREFERLVGTTSGEQDFRKNVIARMGAWAIENPAANTAGGEVPYERIFPDLMDKLLGHHRESQNTKIRAMGALLLDVDSFDATLSANPDRRQLSESTRLALTAFEGMQKRFGYGPKGAQEVLIELIKDRFV